MSAELKSFMQFKMEQHLRTNGISLKGDKVKAGEILKANMKAWVMEAVAAGVK